MQRRLTCFACSILGTHPSRLAPEPVGSRPEVGSCSQRCVAAVSARSCGVGGWPELSRVTLLAAGQGSRAREGGATSETDAHKIMASAHGCGVDFFDTANVYGLHSAGRASARAWATPSRSSD